MLPSSPNVIVFDSLPSTQDAALEYLRAGRRDADGVRALHQTAGRGRRSADWFSAPEGSLAVSFILWDEPVPVQPWVLGMAMAAAVASACEETGCGPALLKWPNDVLVSGCKVAGVLVEVERDAAVIGVGVNVNATEFPPDIAGQATSLRAVCGRELDVPDFADAVWRHFREQDRTLPAVVAAFRRRDGTTGRRYSASGRTGTALGITDEGLLLIRWDDGGEDAVPVADS